MLFGQDSPSRSAYASTQHWCFAFLTREDLSQLTVSKSRYQRPAVLYGFEKYLAPLQQFTEGAMFTTHGMEMKLSF